MSSIDKDMQSIAWEYDRRVRVRNTSISKDCGGCNGYIKFYIGSECILSIKDRYGFIHDDEISQIRNAIRAYQQRERDVQAEQERRRREEEERRRREEEERRRREEAERVAAYKSLKASVAMAKEKIAASFAIVSQTVQNLESKINKIVKSLDGAKYDVSKIKSQIQTLEIERQRSIKSFMQERDEKIAQISRYENPKNNLTTNQYNQLKQEVLAVNTVLSSNSFNQQSVDQMQTHVDELLKAQEDLFKQCADLQKYLSDKGAVKEYAKLSLQFIENVDKSSLQDINTAIARLQETQSQIKKCKEETAIYSIVERLTSAPALSIKQQEFAVRQSTYEFVDYSDQCKEVEKKLQAYYEQLKNKTYTTATKGELEHIERTLQQVSIGTGSKNMLDSLKEMLDVVQIIHADDVCFDDVFKDYEWLKNELSKVGVDAEPLDALNYTAQRERLLDSLYEQQATYALQDEKEASETKRSMLSLGLRSAFAKQGLYYMSGKLSESEMAEEDIFVLPGVDDVVIKAIVSEDSLHWFVCGTQKEDGTSTSAERVLEVMREMDRSGKPQEILTALSQSIQIQSGTIENAVDSQSENAIDAIIQNGKVDLSQMLNSGDGLMVSMGDVMREISETFKQEAEQNRLVYNARVQGTTKIGQNQSEGILTTIDKRLKERKKREMRQKCTHSAPQRRTANASRKMYMNS